jgi:aspartyl-tRNA(Asn)/glutamyl-tRNA(Gln) amidotransferase subunit A
MGRTMREEAPAGIFLARPEQPAEGTPLAVKDLFETAGLVTTYGSAIFADNLPATSAEAVRRLEAAGYANVGKTNLHEFAYGITSQNPHYGTVPNPAAQGRTSGGSSGGSAAALAAGLVEAALGTDSGGSIRIPAACCAIVGFKPTYDLVSLDGCFPLASTFDHAGPMARSVDDCERMLAVLVDEFEPRRLALEDVAIGVAWTELADPLVGRRVEEAAAHFPRRRSLDFPLPQGLSRAFQREVADVHRDLFAEFADLYGDNVRVKIERCLEVGERDYDEALRRRDEYRERCLEALDGMDLLVTPTLPCVPPPADVEELEVRETLIRFTFPFNALGWPALALPCGRAEEALPASVQVIGRPSDDALVLAAAASLEGRLPRMRTSASAPSGA